jgi:hypothetical protein
MFSHQQSSRRQEKQHAKGVLFYQRNVFLAKGKDVKRVPREVSKLVMILKLNGNEK